MQMGMIGLGRMGANMVRRLLKGGHECVVFDMNKSAVAELVKEGAIGAASLDELTSKLKKPRTTWMMVPAGVVEETLADLNKRFEKDDIIVDGGNSYYIDDLRRAKMLRTKGIHYVDSGTSGGVWGLERGYSVRWRRRSTPRRAPPVAKSRSQRPRNTATCIAAATERAIS